jgi:Tol biopolymer transport system component
MTDTRHGGGQRRWASILLALAAAWWLGGCANLTIRAEPDDSLITLKDPGGRLVKAGVGLVEEHLTFGDAASAFIVEVEPSKDNAAKFVSARRELNEAAFNALPLVPGTSDVKLLTVKLEQKQYADLMYVEVVLDPHRRWRGLVTASRAYTDPAEQGGATPSKIVDFGDNLGITGLTLSPDGGRIVYSVASYEKIPILSDTISLNEDRLISLKGANLRGVTTGGGGGIQQITQEDFRDMYPAFSADGKSLLFSSNRRRPDFADLLMIDASGRGGVANVYVDPREDMALRPSVAADGVIAFALYRAPKDGAGVEVWTVGGPKGFPTQIAKGSQPQVSPDGKRIAYIGQDGNLWVTDVGGTNQAQLTFGAAEILKRYEDSLSPVEKALFLFNKTAGYQTVMPYSFPSWSPDGRFILYTGMEGVDAYGRPNEDIWIMAFDGSGKQQLTTNGSADRYPLMSPDKKFIYFMSNRAKHWAIWRIPTPDAVLKGGT